MNATERRYAAALELRRHAGEIRRWIFEPFSVRLAHRTFYRPDFLVWLEADGSLEIHEVKGQWTDAAKIKVKVAATLHPWFRFVVVYRGRAGAFELEEVSA